MNTARTVGTSAIVCALALALVGCNQTAANTRADTTLQKERFNTEVCNAAPWIRERAPAGLCEAAPVVDDDMSLRRLHEELERSGR
jgi:hypothetical protein